jgi:CheY-like chemotaxis protein
VLVTEDNDAIRMLITAMLSRNGHSVTEANDGRAAVAAVRLAKPDIILMDMQMPVMDGPSAMRIIRMEESASARIPIIALTADALKENRAAYLAAGAESLLVKPIDWQVLFSEMDRLTAPSRHAPVCGETSLR